MEVPSSVCDHLGGIPMTKMLLLGAAFVTLALSVPAQAELKFKPGEDPASTGRTTKISRKSISRARL
jgi:hypothetical protein